ncbi:tyrosine-type recombinase/integrase [Sulfurimonas sediminis]|uniref:Tyrosine-type recombinase/integrase n=1 Tax=Sulfurimonas sediminis TaxID=2590020 RepID=A0A7M1B4N7_9BACT|nr:tyrosine-type recombinase/integrase [Sulfurimonas sediminis]QOP43662.1 tyrosine-type recombinase/integrase [Sulfurimonas sediminis]
MFLRFDLKKVNTSGLYYKNDGQIPSSKIKNNKIINSNITFTKPYKIQVRASKMINGKILPKKKTLDFSPSETLLNAVKKAAKKYEQMMDNLSSYKINQEEFSKTMLYKDVFEKYIQYKIDQYKHRDDKGEFDYKERESFHNKWLQSILNKPIGEIDEEDIQNAVINIKKAGRSERTSRKVYQFTNPVFKYFNMKAKKFGNEISSPALQRDLSPLNNQRGLDLELEEIKLLFKKLKSYRITPAREIFMFLMHGRRLNEVLTLEWHEIDFKNNTYLIPKEKNKANKDMTYKLSHRLKEMLESIGIKENGYVFTQEKDKSKPYSASTLHDHWKKLNTSIVKHQIRNCIVVYLKNKMRITDNVIAGAILGHKQNKTITDAVYGQLFYKVFGDTLDEMLDDIFDEKPVAKQNEQDKLEELEKLFPNKSKEELKKVLEILG